MLASFVQKPYLCAVITTKKGIAMSLFSRASKVSDEHQFGAMPLSNDILTKSHIGLWAFELDEGSAPRMYADEAMLGLLGLKERLAPERIYHAWYDNIDANCYGLVDDAVKKMVAGEHAEVQYPWRHPDGQLVTVRCGGVRNFAYKKGIRIEGCHQNVTQILHFDADEQVRLSEEVVRQRQQLKTDYNAIRGLASGYDEVHLFNLDTDLYNPYYIEDDDNTRVIMSEYADYPSAHKAFVQAYCHPDDREAMLRLADKDYLRELLKGKRRYAARFRCKTFLDEYRWTEIQVVKFEAPSHEASQLAIGLFDVEEEVQRNQALEEARMQRESHEQRYNFLINITHELRTPLTLILGPLRSMLSRGTLSERDQKTVTRVCQQGERMTVLLNTVLTSNKIEQGATGVHPELMDLNAWVRELSEEFREEASNHNMAILVQADKAVGKIPMDAGLCRIVFSNLVMNALRYNANDNPLEISTSLDKQAGMVRISVKDHGTGFGDVDTSKLFERFYRATEEKMGFGIGLSYSKVIVDAHHGRMGAQNNTDCKGATFWFELPVK